MAAPSGGPRGLRIVPVEVAGERPADHLGGRDGLLVRNPLELGPGPERHHRLHTLGIGPAAIVEHHVLVGKFFQHCRPRLHLRQYSISAHAIASASWQLMPPYSQMAARSS